MFGMTIYFSFGLLLIAGFWLAHLRNRGLQACIMVGLVLRLVVGAVEVLGGQLPFSGGDTTAFLATAEYWSRSGFWDALNYYPGPSSYFISWIIALLYGIFGSELSIAILPSILFGTLSISVAHSLAFDLFKTNWIALRAAWLTALFPMLILLSASVLREAYIFYFFGLAMLLLLRWVNSRNIFLLVGCFASLVVCTFFHAGMVASIGIVGVLVVSTSLREVLMRRGLVISLKTTLLAFGGLVLMLFLLQAGIELPKVGNLTSNINDAAFVDKLLTDAVTAKGGAVYPDWVLPSSEVDLVRKVPLLLFYFLFGPFLWDVRSAWQLIGVVDAFLYIIFFWLIWRRWALLRRIPGARLIFWVTLFSACVFAMSTSNFGTSIRHRAKFAVVIVALAPLAPFSGRRAPQRPYGPAFPN